MLSITIKVLASQASQPYLSRQDLCLLVLKVRVMFTDGANIYIPFESMQIKLLFQTGFDEAELKGYISVIHANVYQTIKVRNTWKGVLVISLSA